MVGVVPRQPYRLLLITVRAMRLLLNNFTLGIDLTFIEKFLKLNKNYNML